MDALVAGWIFLFENATGGFSCHVIHIGTFVSVKRTVLFSYINTQRHFDRSTIMLLHTGTNVQIDIVHTKINWHIAIQKTQL